jgi:hypothetical protein
MSDGTQMSSETIQRYLSTAISQLERYLDIKITKQIINETKDFYYNDWIQWNCVRTTFSVNAPFELAGVVGNVKQIIYPKDWISTRKSSDGQYYRGMFIIAGSSTSQSQPVMISGSLAYLPFNTASFIPNYWHVTYVTGFDVIPAEIVDVLGKFASINVLAVLGDSTYKPGISSSSISIDGLSQSTSSIVSGQGGIYAGRIKQYQDELKQQLIDLRSFYRGLSMVVC